jgi:putative membrane protein
MSLDTEAAQRCRAAPVPTSYEQPTDSRVLNGMSDKQELASTRTDFAEDRTVLANERTFASWYRTGFAAIGIGVGFNALFNRLDPEWVPKAIATAFLVIGIIIFVAAERRACAVLARLHAHQVKTVGIGNLRFFTFAAVFATAALIAAMWLLRFRPPGV